MSRSTVDGAKRASRQSSRHIENGLMANTFYRAAGNLAVHVVRKLLRTMQSSVYVPNATEKLANRLQHLAYPAVPSGRRIANSWVSIRHASQESRQGPQLEGVAACL